MKQFVVELHSGEPVCQQLGPLASAWHAGAYASLLVHVFCGLVDVTPAVEAVRIIQDLLPEAQVVGTMSAGEICEGRLVARGVVISAIMAESSNIRVLRYDNVKGSESKVGDALCQELGSIGNLRAVELLFPGTEMDTRALYYRLSECQPGVSIFGGYSGGHELNSPQHFLIDAKGVLRDSMYAVAYAGSALCVNVNKLVGWDSLGLPFSVTKAQGNRLIELNGRPASEVYERFLQIDRTQIDNAMAGYEFPLMATHGGEENMRSTIHIDEDGALVLHGHIPEESQVYLSYGNPSHIVALVNERLRELSAFGPQAILLFTCIVRKQFWGDLVNAEMAPFAKVASTAGFHTWGEVMRDMRSGEVVEHNVTQLSVAMREGDAKPSTNVGVHVDESVLRGQASLLSRLANLVTATMGELEAAHNDLMMLNQRLTVMAERDALTGLYNRGKTEQLIHAALDQAVQSGETVALIMTDIDHLKQVNDTFGHSVGDSVLQDVARLLKEAVAVRACGAAGRWGGEEFFLLLPQTELQDAVEVAEELRRRVELHAFAGAGHVTMSFGVLAVSAADVSVADRKGMFTAVDDALYRAKNEGRNRIVAIGS